MCYSPVLLSNGTLVPCGRCEACQIQYNKEWTLRIMDEFEVCGKVGCMATLTYDEEHLPADRQLCADDMCKFIKRLRWMIRPHKLRYYACGEYGGKTDRPHFHIIFFNWSPPDKTKVALNRYSSDLLKRAWKQGFVSVGDITLHSAKYCAKYLSKCDRRWHDVKPFSRMSNRPGIGYGKVSPELLLTGERYIDGEKFLIPRYYIRKLQERGINTEMYMETRRHILDRSPVPDYKALAKASEDKLNAFVP